MAEAISYTILRIGFPGPKAFNRILVDPATTWAEDLGIREGMSVKKALEIMDLENSE
jgi:uncharacterized protein YunC (DUF1805 family)